MQCCWLGLEISWLVVLNLLGLHWACSEACTVISGNSDTIWDHTVLPATRLRWHSCLYLSRNWYSIWRPRRDARLSWPRWLVREIVCPYNSHPSWTNRVRCWLTSLMRPTMLTTTPSHRKIKKWLMAATPSTWNFGSTGPGWSEIADFEPIFARSASAVTSSKKVQLMLIERPLRTFQWA